MNDAGYGPERVMRCAGTGCHERLVGASVSDEYMASMVRQIGWQWYDGIVHCPAHYDHPEVELARADIDSYANLVVSRLRKLTDEELTVINAVRRAKFQGPS